APRDLRDRAAALHLPCTHSRKWRGAGVLRKPGSTRISDVAASEGGIPCLGRGCRMKIERHDFLVEIGTEELPPKALHGLEEALTSGIRAGLEKAALEHADIISYATPRRLAVLVKRLAARQADQDLKRKGPPV